MRPLLPLLGSLGLLAGFPPAPSVAADAPAAIVAPAPASPPAAPAAAAAPDPFWPTDGVFPVPGRTSAWAGFRAKNIQRRAQFAERKQQDQDSLVFVGDSITEGWRTLEQDFADLGVKVANRGIGGDTTPNLVHRLQDDVLSLKPRGLVLLIGTNDLGERTSPEQIVANIAEIHARIRAQYPAIPMALCLVMPRRADYAERIKDVNARLIEFAKPDPRMTVCDTFTPLAQEDGTSKPEAYNADRLHLNPAGYAAWRAALHPIVANWKL